MQGLRQSYKQSLGKMFFKAKQKDNICVIVWGISPSNNIHSYPQDQSSTNFTSEYTLDFELQSLTTNIA